MMMLRTVEAANYFDLRKCSLEVWRVRGGGPVFLKLGKAVKYRKGDLDTFIKPYKTPDSCLEMERQPGGPKLI